MPSWHLQPSTKLQTISEKRETVLRKVTGRGLTKHRLKVTKPISYGHILDSACTEEKWKQQQQHKDNTKCDVFYKHKLKRKLKTETYNDSCKEFYNFNPENHNYPPLSLKIFISLD